MTAPPVSRNGLAPLKDNLNISTEKTSSKLIEFFISILGSLIILDHNYNYVYVNESAAHTAGIASKELIGVNIWQRFPALVGTIFEKNVREAMEQKEIRRFEWSGAYANIALEFMVAPLDEGALISCEDLPRITGETLEGKEDKYQYLIKHAPTGICEIDYSKLKFKSVNETICNLLGYNEKEILSMNILDVLDGDGKDRFQKRIERGLVGEKLADSTEYRLITKNGRELWVVLDAKLTYNDGKLDSVLIVMHDVTERKQMQAKIEEYNKNLEKLVDERTKQLQDKERLAAIGQTAGMVGHDIRNPLQAILGDIYLAKLELSSLAESYKKESLQESLESIQRNAEYINKIVSDLQDFAKPLTPNLEEVDLKTTLNDLLPENLPKNIKACINMTDESRKIQTDPTYIKRILGNLISNANQAMPEGGRITIQTNKNNQTNNIIITVEDTGLGIPEEIKPKIFTPLFTTKSKGQGFGLAVVKRLVEAQGGTISFESQTGKGTKFIINLPQNKSS